MYPKEKDFKEPPKPEKETPKPNIIEKYINLPFNFQVNE